MSYPHIHFQPAQDYNLEVLMGNVPGHSMIIVAGHDEAATTSKAVVSSALGATGGDINQSAIHAAADTVWIASTDANDTSAGTGARTVRIEGLDANGNVQTETVSLSGQTAVETSGTWTAINGFTVLTAGSGGNNAGNLWVGEGTFTAGIPATKYFSGDATYNHGLTAYYTVPTGYTAYAREFTVAISEAGKAAEVIVQTSTNGGTLWVTAASFGMASGPFSQGSVMGLSGLGAGEHLRVLGASEAGTADIIVIFEMELVAD